MSPEVYVPHEQCTASVVEAPPEPEICQPTFTSLFLLKTFLSLICYSILGAKADIDNLQFFSKVVKVPHFSRICLTG